MKRIRFPPSAFHFLLTAWVFLPDPPRRTKNLLFGAAKGCTVSI
jgi:hypothetical protein